MALPVRAVRTSKRPRRALQRDAELRAPGPQQGAAGPVGGGGIALAPPTPTHTPARLLRSCTRLPEAAGAEGKTRGPDSGEREGAPGGGGVDPSLRPLVGLSGCPRVSGALEAVEAPAL